MTHSNLQSTIETAFEARSTLNLQDPAPELRDAVETAIRLLDRGEARVAQKTATGWTVNQWLKKAVLLYFGMEPSVRMPGGYSDFYDKVPMKYRDWSAERFAAAGTRVVPGAIVRQGAHVAGNVILMPSFVNIGAYVDSGTMVDTWATVGSCAQIGRNVHLSGGVGIGGVLEPVQSAPTIIEDNCFIGARSEIVEGVVVEEGAVISMGVFIGQSTRIYDRDRDEVSYGRVPAGAVVVPGSLPSGRGQCSLYCAVIVKRVDARTRARVSLNDLLRSD
ncbi:MAG: 2,3,4,5-tetrahydropyridine-2,6-dicarboxylate N-succinyltransferase [Gammaproteobacteria bacterium]|nr:2,3,4,5-tetrahydropyridine-2,6-dicarboxylate N-succinyltransferase [Gammaproteobacteria bacterium]